MSPDAEKFLKTYNGEQLRKKHSLSEFGAWQIYGEDPNCDLGGSHHEPLLDTIEGRLDQVVNVAVALPKFWQWGAGGRIVKVVIKNVTDFIKRSVKVTFRVAGNDEQRVTINVLNGTKTDELEHKIKAAILALEK